MSDAALDTFGQLLMARVRDKAILEWGRMLDGEVRDEGFRLVRDRLAVLDGDQRQAVRWLLGQVVDTVLYHLLWTLDETECVEVAVSTGPGQARSLREAAPDLPRELSRWILEFSRDPGDERST